MLKNVSFSLRFSLSKRPRTIFLKLWKVVTAVNYQHRYSLSLAVYSAKTSRLTASSYCSKTNKSMYMFYLKTRHGKRQEEYGRKTAELSITWLARCVCSSHEANWVLGPHQRIIIQSYFKFKLFIIFLMLICIKQGGTKRSFCSCSSNLKLSWVWLLYWCV